MQKYLEKKKFYLKKQAELAEKDYSEEIERRVEAFRQSVVFEVEEERAKDIEKINNYLELLDELIEEDFEEAKEQDSTVTT